MTRMPTWQHFLKVRLGTCVESWVEQKAKLSVLLKSLQIFEKKSMGGEMSFQPLVRSHHSFTSLSRRRLTEACRNAAL
jgi:hypothetical protein